MTQKLAFDQLQSQAIALRRAGKSRREIMQVMGVGNSTLDRALRGVPPPPWTSRPRAKDDLHAKARDLRSRGYTYTEIAADLGVAKSSVSLWVRDLPRVGRISYEEIRKRNATGVSRYWQAEGLRRKARRQTVKDAAAAEIGRLNDREVLIAGAIAYWCEGSKAKPHRPSEEIAFINSDPQLISFFLRFLDVAGVTRDRLICRVYIHESADVAAAQQFWLDLTGLADTQFRRPTLKRHNPRTVRKNTGQNYHGCLVIRVRQSAELYRQVEGWATAAMAAGATAGARESEGSPAAESADIG
jgi:transcriptional regulator with XRE-family HTH domain